MTRRTDRVEDLIRRELSEIIHRQVADPRVRLATVSAVEITPNLARAEVRISALGSEEERQEAMAGLRHAAGYLRRQLGPRLRLRRIPELVFTLDRGAEHSARISEILEDLSHDDDQAT